MLQHTRDLWNINVTLWHLAAADWVLWNWITGSRFEGETEAERTRERVSYSIHCLFHWQWFQPTTSGNWEREPLTSAWIHTSFDRWEIIPNQSTHQPGNVHYHYLGTNTYTQKEFIELKLQRCDHKNIHSKYASSLSDLGRLKWLSSCVWQGEPSGKTEIIGLGSQQTRGLKKEKKIKYTQRLDGWCKAHTILEMSGNVEQEKTI